MALRRPAHYAVKTPVLATTSRVAYSKTASRNLIKNLFGAPKRVKPGGFFSERMMTVGVSRKAFR
jgi:hypothetical protein